MHTLKPIHDKKQMNVPEPLNIGVPLPRLHQWGSTTKVSPLFSSTRKMIEGEICLYEKQNTSRYNNIKGRSHWQLPQNDVETPKLLMSGTS